MISALRYKILAIDDTRQNQVILESLLRNEFDIRIASSGAEGFAMAVAEPPDLILLDVMMPEMDGFETCRLLKADAQLASVPVIFITALSDIASETTGLALGAADFIQKPFNLAVIVQRIRNLLDREQLRKQVELQRDNLQALSMTRDRQISELQDSESRKTAIMESSLDGLISIDEDGRIIDLNLAAESMFGYERNEVIGFSMAELMVPERFRQAHTRGMQRYRETGEASVLRKRIEVPALRKNGEEFLIELTIAPFISGGHEHFLGTIRDISEQKLRDAEKSRLDDLLQQTLNDLAEKQSAIDEHAIVSITDKDGTILYANDRFCSISQYSSEELIGSNHRILKSGLHTADFYRNIWQTICSGKTWHGEIANRKKCGETYWVSSTIRPLPNTDGSIKAFIAIRTDITQQKITKQLLADSNVELSGLVEKYRAAEQEVESARKRELDIGNQIQQTLLFGTLPVRIGGLSMAAYAEPSKGIAGDFYQYFAYNKRMFDIAIGDVMGKGIPAALIAAAFKQQLNQSIAALLAENTFSGHLPQPEEIIGTLHERMTPQLRMLESFVTLAYLQVDLGLECVRYLDAGHTPAIHISNNGASLLKGNNLPIGVIESETYQQQTISLQCGDLLFLYSDGITEARNPQGNEFGSDKLINLLCQMHKNRIPARIMIQMVRHMIDCHEGNNPLQDDRSCIALHYEGESESLQTIRMVDLPWQMESLSTLRINTAECAEIVRLSDKESSALVLAAVETLSNIIRHAQPPLPDASIHIQLLLTNQGIAIVFHYLGDVFKPAASTPDFSGHTEGGFGLYIIANSVDSVVYDSPIPGICRIRLEKNRLIGAHL